MLIATHTRDFFLGAAVLVHPAPSEPARLTGRLQPALATVRARARTGLTDSRMVHAFLGLAYLLFYWVVYYNYLSVRWGYTGLIYRPMVAWEYFFIATGVAIVAYSLPTRLKQPSSLVLWLLFAFVYLPTMAQTFMLGERASQFYTAALVALTVAMVGVCWITRSKDEDNIRSDFILNRVRSNALVILFVAATAVIIFQFRDIMTFADVMNSEDVYATRFSAADRTSGFIGYLRTYHTFVFAPIVVALGLLIRRSRWLFLLGVSGVIVSYMVDASKISLVIPVAMLAIYVVVRFLRCSVIAMTGGMAALTLLTSALANYSGPLRFVADLLLFRSIAIPGQQLAQYYDLFEARGFTWWSNIRGVSLFVPPPAAFEGDPRWPVLGQIVGEEYYGFSSRMNSNANPFVGEGVAAGGPVGILVIGAILAAYLWVLDRASFGWNRLFVLLVIAPVGLALTNGHLSTILVSFGGAFWVLALAMFGPYPRLVPWQVISRSRRHRVQDRPGSLRKRE